MRRGVCVLAAALCLFGGAAEASVTKLDFETFAAGETARNQYPGVRISGAPAAAIAAPASRLVGTGARALFDNPATLATEAHAPRRVLTLAEAGMVSFAFDRAVKVRGLKVFGASRPDSVSVDFYDINNLLIGSAENGMVTAARGEYLDFAFDMDGVQRVVVELAGPGAVDDLVYETADAPAPTALILSLAAFAGLGVAMRRRGS